jgi:outer membrane murein-binding lipoprotein Lpp
MSDDTPNGSRSGVRFDPTINLGHICTAAVFLSTAVLSWASVSARVDQVAKDADRLERKQDAASIGIETRLLSRINDERARLDQTAVRAADDIREIKTLMRDGFRDLDSKLERKVDKPARSAFMAIVGLWTGTTISSQKKDQTIADTAKAAAAKVP